MNNQEIYRAQSLNIRRRQLGRIPRRLRTGRFLSIAFSALVLVLVLPCTSFAQSALTDDADTDNGNTPNLTLSSGSNVYLKFKLSSTLPANTPDASVAKATIKLYLGAVHSPGAVDVYLLSSNWSEKTITSAPPALGDILQTGILVQSDLKEKFLVLDVTTAVQQWLGTDGVGTGGAPNFGVALVARDGASLTFDSKENSQTSHEAQLTILLEQAADGLQRVEHDASLTGDGTSASPLGVANGGIDSVHLANDAVTAEKIVDNAVTSTELADGSVTSSKITAPLSLTSANANFTLSAANTGTGAAITAAGTINTSTQYNIGGNRILSIAGTGNLFAGVGAGSANTTGIDNAFFGRRAGSTNTTGFSNSFFGTDAGLSNTTGTANSFFGRIAGFLNTTGIGNSFFGNQAGSQNTTGSVNSFFGSSAGSLNTTGSANSFFGFAAGVFNTTGSFNAIFGSEAGRANTTGNGNSLFGYHAGLANTTGGSNAFFGIEAGLTNTTGSANSFLGTGAGRANTTGNFNAFFGELAGKDNTTGGANAFFGDQAGSSNQAGINNTFIGRLARFIAINTTGNDNTLLGANSIVESNISNATAIGSRSQVTESNSLILGGITGVNGGTNTNVGIGTTAPKARFDVTGGNILVGSPGQGIILKSPNGATCRLLSIDNAGALVVSATACP